MLAGKDSICIDPFAGSGGNVIQFSKNCKKIYANDIDPKKIEICQNNCKVYECDNNIEFFESDFLKFDVDIKVDYVFLSPPWGGIDYKNNRNYSLKKMVTPDITEIVKKSLQIGKNIMFYLPRNIDIMELGEILFSVTSNPNIYLDIHLLESANKLKAILLIYGYDLNSSISKFDVKLMLEILNNTSGSDPKVKLTSKNTDEEDNFIREITKLLRKNGIEKEKECFIIEKKVEETQDQSKDPDINILTKIFTLIGGINFFEAIIKFKDKYLGLNNDPINSLIGKLKLKDLLNYFLKEILTDKQLSRLNP